MALRTPLFLANPAVQHSAVNDRLGLMGAILRPSPQSTATNLPLLSRGGALMGPPGTMGEVTLLSNAGFTINPARFYIPGSAGSLEGVYEVINDAVSPTLPITAQNATQWRRSYVGVWVRDSFPANTGPDDAQYGVQDGPLAASNPALPLDAALPANFIKLGELLIPPVGQNVTWTPYYPRTSLRGGILPVQATEANLPAYDGEYRDHPTLGLQRGLGGVWTTPNPADPGPAFRLQGAAGFTTQTIANAAWTPLAVPLAAIVEDTHNGFIPSSPTATQRWRCPRAGLYMFSLTATLSGNATGRRFVRIAKAVGANGVVDINSADNAPSQDARTPLGTASQSLSMSAFHRLALNDEVEFGVYQDSGVALTMAYATSRIQGAFIRS